CGGGAAGGDRVRRSVGAANAARFAARAICVDGGGQVVDLRAGARRGVLRSAGVAVGRSWCGGKRLPVVVGDSRHRRECPVSAEESRTMIVTRKAIPRRVMLKGLGATVALPFLDAMVPAFGRLAAAPKTSRLS